MYAIIGLLFCILMAILGIIPAVIAMKKGRDVFSWWLYGFLLFIVALPHSLMLELEPGHKAGMRKCPKCAQFIRNEAAICRHCGADLNAIFNARDSDNVVSDITSGKDSFPIARNSNINYSRRSATTQSKKCPYCAELINADAHVCQYCEKDLTVKNPDIKQASDMKECPYCSELIKTKAKLCRYCKKTLVVSASTGTA